MSESSHERPEGERRPRAAGILSRALAEASPTWELELLVSGAVLVALFQISGLIDRAFDRVMPHVTSASEMSVIYGYMYGKAMVLTLVTTFVVHLATRGYWVGLVGLHSVFPGGVRWDELHRYGPYAREAIRERLPPLPRTIGRLDNFCSVLFSFGFLVALFFGVSLLVMGVLGGLAYVIAHLALGGRGTPQVFYVLLALGALVPTGIVLVDRSIGPRVDAAAPRGRALRRAAAAYYHMSGLSLFGGTLLTLMSNTRRRLTSALFGLAILAIFAVIFVQVVARRGVLEINNYTYFAQPGRFTVDASHYESQRAADDPLPVTPTIQSDVIREPFVKLFIPYVPERHNPAMASSCPGLMPLRKLGLEFSRPGDEDQLPDTAVTAALRCFAKLHRVTLNGAPLENLELQFHVHPRNALRGVVTYIPATGLPRGRNVLTVQRAPPAPDARRRPPRSPHVIPFWL